MKKLISILFLLPLFSQAQVSADFGIGAAFSNSSKTTNVNPAMNLGVSYNFHNVIFRGDFYGNVTREYTAPKIITGAAIGYQISGFIPSVGYYSLNSSSDDKSLNSRSVGYSLEYYKELHEDRGVFGRVLYVGKYTFITVGARVNF